MKLTVRQEQVGKLLCLGKTDKEVAADLDLGLRTIHDHVIRLRKKLSARNRVHLVAKLARMISPY